MSEMPEDGIGKGRPPADRRFKPGVSGNSKGRPRGRHRIAPYETILGQLVTVRENGRERRLPADAAFLLHLANKGIAGDGAAARAAQAAIETAHAKRGNTSGTAIAAIVLVGDGSVSNALDQLGMGKILDRYRTSARMMLEPWLVEAALARLGSRRLSRSDQEMVLAATRAPHKVRWPDWWAARSPSSMDKN